MNAADYGCNHLPVLQSASPVADEIQAIRAALNDDRHALAYRRWEASMPR